MKLLARRLPDPRLWLRVLCPHWPRAQGDPLDGCSILLPVPSDLPVFYRMAAQVIGRQSLAHVNEIIVIPDYDTTEFEATVLSGGSSIGSVPLVYCSSASFTSAVSRLYGRPNFLHSMQIIRGLGQTQSRYALLHDADLFISDQSFIDRQYETMASRGLNVLGVSPVWDGWYAENGMPHVTATWEMMLSTEWAKSFDPILLTPHSGVVRGLDHKFDTLLRIQCLTAPETIDRVAVEDRFVHFNYVICTYRNFVRSRRRFVDDRFILMLLRILIDEFDRHGHYPRVPSWEELVLALHSSHPRIAFPDPASGRAAYPETRSKLDRFLDLPLISAARRSSITRSLAAFDEVYLGTQPTESPGLLPAGRPDYRNSVQDQCDA